MVEVLVTSLNAVVPIILLILLGYLLKRFKFLNDNFVKIGNKFVFKVCLPCMLFINIYDGMDSFADIRWDVVLYSVITILVIFGLGLVTAILTTKKKNRRGVILQCSFRSNFAIIGLALVESLGGDKGLASIVSAFSIPIFNILAVIALSIFAEEETPVEETATEQLTIHDQAMEEGTQSSPCVKAVKSKHSVKKILLNIIKNPLIIGVFVGLVFVAVREIERACGGVDIDGNLVFSFKVHLKFLYTCTSNLKAIASPLALIVLGGQFQFTAVKGMTKEIIVATAWRVLLAPLIGIGVALLLSTYTDLFTFGAEVYPTLIALFGTPVAVSSAIMAGEMKNDEQLATQLVVWTSLCSIVTIFVTVFLIGLITV
ncbi:MAG: AEC family transporter [Clostridia bacterium]|nr:AEC family transporter [Clostridia bacterium]